MFAVIRKCKWTNSAQSSSRDAGVSPKMVTANSLDSIIIVSKPNIPQTPPPTTPPTSPSIHAAHAHTLTKLIVALRPLVLRVASQHTLDTHADALDALDGAPARGAEEI